MRIRKILSVSVALLLYPSFCGATIPQNPDSTSQHYISIQGDRGIITPTNDFVKGINANNKKMSDYSALSVVYGWQTRGTKEWHHTFDFPSIGVGIETLWLDNKKEIGQPISFYGFFKGKFFRYGAHALLYNIETGLAFKWKCFDQNTNPYNIAIGSKATVHLGLAAEYTYTIAKRVTLGLGAGLTHFSNGAVRKPNKGINLFAPKARVTYHFEKVDIPLSRRLIPKMKQNEIDITVGYGIKSYECDTVAYPDAPSMYMDPKFHSITLQGTFLHRYCPKGKYGAGLSVVYDNMLGTNFGIDNGKLLIFHGKISERFSLGVFAVHEFCIGNLSIPIQVGYYLWQSTGDLPTIYRIYDSFQRAGLKYTFNCNIHSGVNIYAHHLSRADFIEWNIGYSLKFKEKRPHVSD